MIFEYALEPALLASWDRFQRLVALFGITKGRLISRYPKRWARMVYDSVPSGTTEKAKVEVALRRVEQELLLPRKHQWNVDMEWLPNAISEHGRSPFQAILATANSTDCSLVIDARDLDCTDLHVLLKAGPSQILSRDADELARVMRPLLLISKKILVVEPNFTIKSPRFQGPLSAILMATLDVQMRVRTNVEIELHLGIDKLEEYADKSAALNSFLASHIPLPMTITIVGWHKDDLHNRYIISDRGGVQIGEGLGLPDARSSRVTDTFALLDDSTAGQLMDQYCNVAKHKFTHRVRGTKHVV